MKKLKGIWFAYPKNLLPKMCFETSLKFCFQLHRISPAWSCIIILRERLCDQRASE